ncbi:MAG TPA: GyrI-like domain-containing protein [Flavobacteriaceae bacterium]|nr:GyrI-like domain-containing protein [Flavobacteriaceae bacterium]
MTPRIETITGKKLIGNHLTMSLANNKTADLWKNFMPRRKEITNNLNEDLISIQVYQPDYFKNFKPANEFEKWAAVEVSDFENLPKGMETFILPSGLYAVFDYKGPAGNPAVFQHIFQVWLPNSDYVLDDRPHFEVLGKNYKNNAPDSEEEIWIPMKSK